MTVKFHDSKAMPSRPLRVMLYGQTRVGKTSAAATFPRPLFLSVALEGGDTTLRMFDGVKVAQINSQDEMLEAVDLIAKDPSICDTVVVDSVTFYCDLVIHEIVKKRNRPMQMQDWGLLDNHVMKNLLPKLHRLPQHVVWIALDKAERDESTGAVTRVIPMLYGAQAMKLPAQTDLIIYMDKKPIQCEDGVMRMFPVFNVAPDGLYIAGGRFGGAFETGTLWPHWTSIAQRVGSLIGLTDPQTPTPVPGAPNFSGVPQVLQKSNGTGLDARQNAQE